MIDPTAIIDPTASVGNGTFVWHFSHIDRGAKVGNYCTIGQNVYVGKDVIIGDGCRIQNNVSIFSGVTLEDSVFIGPSAVFTNVKYPDAAIDQNFVSTLVRTGAVIGANATIICGNDIGHKAVVGAGAVVTRPVPDGATVVGNPARVIKTI